MNEPTNETSQDARRRTKTKTRMGNDALSEERLAQKRNTTNENRKRHGTREETEKQRHYNGDRPAKTINEEGRIEITTSQRERLTKTKNDDDDDRNTAPRQTSGTLVAPRTKNTTHYLVNRTNERPIHVSERRLNDRGCTQRLLDDA